MENPNDYEANEIAVHETAGVEPDYDPRQDGEEPVKPVYSLADVIFPTFPEVVEADEEGPEESPDYPVDLIFPLESAEEGLLKQLISEQRATRIATEQLVSLFSEAVTTINVLAEKADGLFSGDGPALGGPAGMILGALIPRKRG